MKSEYDKLIEQIEIFKEVYGKAYVCYELAKIEEAIKNGRKGFSKWKCAHPYMPCLYRIYLFLSYGEESPDSNVECQGCVEKRVLSDLRDGFKTLIKLLQIIRERKR